MGKTTIPDIKDLHVPSTNSLAYCRLCFSTVPYKKITKQGEIGYWINYIQQTVGIEMKPEEDAPFAICFGCKTTLESVDQFRLTCRLHDAALRQFRLQAAVGSGVTVAAVVAPPPLIRFSDYVDGGESSNTAAVAYVEIPPTSDESGDSKESSASSPTMDNMCLVCDEKLSSLREYRKHMNKVHNKVGGFVACPVCQRRFRKDFLFQIHVLKHNDASRARLGWTPIKQKRCRICRDYFATGKELGKHELEQHELTFECKLCYRRFATEKDKNTHKEVHLAGMGQGVRKKFKCRICTRAFPNRHCLNLHVKKHERLYRCIACGMRFSKLEAYVEHQTSVHQCRTILSQCNDCKVAFKNRDDFLSHLNLIHSVYDPNDVENDEFSDEEDENQANGVAEQATGQLPASGELETVNLSSDDDDEDDFPIYMEEHEEDENDGDGGGADEQEESTPRGIAITNRLEEELTLEEAPRDSGFDLYGTAFQSQISISLIESD